MKKSTKLLILACCMVFPKDAVSMMEPEYSPQPQLIKSNPSFEKALYETFLNRREGALESIFEQLSKPQWQELFRKMSVLVTELLLTDATLKVRYPDFSPSELEKMGSFLEQIFGDLHWDNLTYNDFFAPNLIMKFTDVYFKQHQNNLDASLKRDLLPFCRELADLLMSKYTLKYRKKEMDRPEPKKEKKKKRKKKVNLYKIISEELDFLAPDLDTDLTEGEREDVVVALGKATVAKLENKGYDASEVRGALDKLVKLKAYRDLKQDVVKKFDDIYFLDNGSKLEEDIKDFGGRLAALIENEIVGSFDESSDEDSSESEESSVEDFGEFDF